MNNLMFRNIMLQTHDKDTTKQVSEDDIFGNEDEQSDVPKYHGKVTILLFNDEYLINI